MKTAIITLHRFDNVGSCLQACALSKYLPDKLGDVYLIDYTHVSYTHLDVYKRQSERDAMHEYGVTLTKLEDVKDADCVIVAVAHNEFKALGLDDIKSLFKSSVDAEKVLIDVKAVSYTHLDVYKRQT